MSNKSDPMTDAFPAAHAHSVRSDVRAGQSVIDQEIKGLQALSGALDQRFSEVVSCIYHLKGRLIISGMGKSGHIARKIVATMASTGTPAYFVHPSEASHGDLGMITPQDAVMVLSNSGETQELQDIIAYTRRFSIPLIALVRRSTSLLVESADYAIVLPEVPEASPTGAPTTSTIMMLAYGDALAIALLERRGFTREDFNVFHPGGRLGKAFLRVESLMHGREELPLVERNQSVRETLLVMTARRFGCAGVCDAEGKLLGIITDGDLRRHMDGGLLDKTAQDIMTASPVTARPQMLAAEALGMMNTKTITCLFVLDDAGVPVGIIHVHDCLRAGIL